MDKLSGPVARAAVVAGLVATLGTGYTAHAAGHREAPPRPTLADTGADANASLLGALSVGAVVTGAAAVALSRRAARGKYGGEHSARPDARRPVPVPLTEEPICSLVSVTYGRSTR
ncbi:hypothetical protein ABR738_18105 [Streptomyces sp. Edi4]|uniref:hypothetical protein n=1 Tax=Streptomyces sp. Edi4 TaxID=3162527 RepID=UPI0033064A90